MRVRALTATGDMAFGRSQGNYYRDQAEAVAQVVKTRLNLLLGEFFLDTADGTAWKTKVFGRNTASTYDVVIRARILNSPGVTAISEYSSDVVRAARALNVQVTVLSLYGPAPLVATINPVAGDLPLATWNKTGWDNSVWG